MKNIAGRKTPRFFVINPVSDRRGEIRFEGSESVAIRNNDTGELEAATAYDIGRRGMIVETAKPLEIGHMVNVIFVNAKDATQCFARVVWCSPKEEDGRIRSGLDIHTWHGIVEGADSWRKFKGIKIKKDRRRGGR